MHWNGATCVDWTGYIELGFCLIQQVNWVMIHLWSSKPTMVRHDRDWARKLKSNKERKHKEKMVEWWIVLLSSNGFMGFVVLCFCVVQSDTPIQGLCMRSGMPLFLKPHHLPALKVPLISCRWHGPAGRLLKTSVRVGRESWQACGPVHKVLLWGERSFCFPVATPERLRADSSSICC